MFYSAKVLKDEARQIVTWAGCYATLFPGAES